jgi:hypothetical protein
MRSIMAGRITRLESAIDAAVQMHLSACAR